MRTRFCLFNLHTVKLHHKPISKNWWTTSLRYKNITRCEHLGGLVKVVVGSRTARAVLKVRTGGGGGGVTHVKRVAPLTAAVAPWAKNDKWTRPLGGLVLQHAPPPTPQVTSAHRWINTPHTLKQKHKRAIIATANDLCSSAPFPENKNIAQTNYLDTQTDKNQNLHKSNTFDFYTVNRKCFALLPRLLPHVASLKQMSFY